MYALYLTLLIISAAFLFLAAVEPIFGKPAEGSSRVVRINLFPLGVLAYELVWVIQLARS